ncbi:MAG: FAD-binding protein, partial [Blastocatellia bacterium]
MPDNTSEKDFEASIRQNVALGPLTTLGIGGPAKYFADADSQERLVAAIRWSRHRGLRLFVIGGGSNLLVADSGFEGLVLRMALSGLDLTANGDRVTIRAGAGIEWDRVVAFAVENGLSGIEC